jgi:hypothetical protein
MNKNKAMAVSMCLLFASGVSAPAGAGDFEAAFLAAEAGNYEVAITRWDALARAGNAQAQFNLGLMYHGGLGSGVNESEAVKWYQKSAENGYPKAQEFLAAAYREGWFGLPRDPAKADYWLKQLEQGM